jgi:1-aminocyclopropane-1-carboxylate synthase
MYYAKDFFEAAVENDGVRLFSDTNPSGILACCVAENNLMPQHELLEKLGAASQQFSGDTLNYTNFCGIPELRQACASFLSRPDFVAHSVSPDDIVISSGMTGVLTGLAATLFNPGDSVLVPAPYYPNFDDDFNLWGDVKTVGVPFAESDDSGRLSDAALNQAYDQACIAGHPPKAMLVTNPNNPVGNIYSEGSLVSIYQWCLSKKIHLIMDEAYAMSVFDADSPSPTARQDFLSMARILNNDMGDYCHIIWGLSKDFGASGLRLGVLYSQNRLLHAALGTMNLPLTVSNFTQRACAAVLSDPSFMAHYIASNRLKLKASYDLLLSVLKPLEPYIKAYPARAGLFVWLDFRELCKCKQVLSKIL